MIYLIVTICNHQYCCSDYITRFVARDVQMLVPSTIVHMRTVVAHFYNSQSSRESRLAGPATELLSVPIPLRQGYGGDVSHIVLTTWENIEDSLGA